MKDEIENSRAGGLAQEVQIPEFEPQYSQKEIKVHAVKMGSAAFERHGDRTTSAQHTCRATPAPTATCSLRKNPQRPDPNRVAQFTSVEDLVNFSKEDRRGKR
jgi:hypothetical protein